MHFCPASIRSRCTQSRNKSIIAASILSTGLLFAPAASASVLVEPRIRQDAPSQSPEPTAPASPSATGQDIVEVASNTIGFSTLTTAITQANIGSVLSGEGPLTVFAPTDEAFAALPSGALESLLLPDNRDLLVKVLYNHVSYGDMTSDQLAVGTVSTFDGRVEVDITPTGVKVNDASVIQADIDASNGVIHVIDQVLLPAGLTEQLQARDAVPTEAVPTEAVPTEETPTTASSQPAAVEEASEMTTPSPEEEPSTAAAEDQPVRALW